MAPTRSAQFRADGHWHGDNLDQAIRRAIEGTPDRAAVIDRSGSITFGDLGKRVDRLAGGLRELGVVAGDVVSVQLPNIREFVEAHLAIERLGAVTNPMLPQYRTDDLRKMLPQLQSRVAIVPGCHRGFEHAAMWADVAGGSQHLQAVVVVGDGASPAGCLRYEEVMVSGDPVTDGQAGRGEDPCIILFTSGTVAAKGVVHTHDTSLYGIRSYQAALRLGPDDVVWMASPVCHATGLQWGVRTAMFLGATLVLQDRWDVHDAARLIVTHSCTVTMGATPFLHDMLTLSPEERDWLSSMRYFVCAGAPIPVEVVNRVTRELGMTVLRAFGMSEHFVSTLCRPDDPCDKRVETDGRALPGTEVAVFDMSRSTQVPSGTDGELAVRGPGVAVGYLNDPERTAETWNDEGWQFTDDLAVLDDEGFVRIIGRRRDLIIRGGLNVSPSEVEALLLEHDRVAEVGVVGIPDERLGERICAVVVPSGAPPSLAELTDFLDTRGVSKIKFPEVLVIEERLPLTPSGKVRKDRLRERVLHAAAAQRTDDDRD